MRKTLKIVPRTKWATDILMILIITITVLTFITVTMIIIKIIINP